jgi:hypothetical protein
MHHERFQRKSCYEKNIAKTECLKLGSSRHRPKLEGRNRTKAFGPLVSFLAHSFWRREEVMEKGSINLEPTQSILNRLKATV